VRKLLSVLLLCFYVFGITKLGFVYSTHNLFHHISHEEHEDNDCHNSCTIIIDAEYSDKHSDTKSFKVSIDNISSHISSGYVFTGEIPDTKFFIVTVSETPPEFTELSSPPPRI
jgi:hypothetical protein